MNWKIFIFIWTVLFIGSCKKSTDPAIVLGYDYYPVQQGSYVDYSVEHITYDDFQDPVKIDTLNYWIREVQDTSFLDNEGRLSHVLLRFRKDSMNGDWYLSRRWYFTPLADRMERVEENVRTIHLAYPVEPGRSWDGNLYNEKDKVIFQTLRMGYSADLNGETYTNCCQIVHENNVNLIERQYGEEIFSYGIGIVYREEIDLKTTFEGEVTSGYETRTTIVNHGVL